MLQYLPAFKLPNGNTAFGERRLPEQDAQSLTAIPMGCAA
jgi:hypothetical protein